MLRFDLGSGMRAPSVGVARAVSLAYAFDHFGIQSILKQALIAG